VDLALQNLVISATGMKKLRNDELTIELYLESHYKFVCAAEETELMERKGEEHAN
jgi:hypothetical protein